MKRAIGYARFSPRPGAAECESIDAQLHDLRLYAARHGYEIVGEYSDPESSGDDEDRPGLWAAMDALQPGYVLLVWKGDRLARSVYLSEYLHREASRKQASIEYQHGRNGDSPDDVLVRQILAAVDEHAKKVNAIRTKYMMLSHQARGRRMSDRPPLGTTVDPENHDRLIENPAEIAVIDRVIEMAADPNYQRNGKPWKREIARQLNREGHPARGEGGWNVTAVIRILQRASTGTASKP